MACTALISTSCVNYASAVGFDFTVTTNDRSDTSDTENPNGVVKNTSDNVPASVHVSSFNRNVNNVTFRFKVVKYSGSRVDASEPREYCGVTDFKLYYMPNMGINGQRYLLRGRYASGSVANVQTRGSWNA